MNAEQAHASKSKHIVAQFTEGVKIPHLDGLGQQVPALHALVEAEDGLVDVVIGDVTGGNGASSGFLQHGSLSVMHFLQQCVRPM